VGVYCVQNSSIHGRAIKFFEAKLQLVRYEELMCAGGQRLTFNLNAEAMPPRAPPVGPEGDPSAAGSRKD
jgi:hypothetical protein